AGVRVADDRQRRHVRTHPVLAVHGAPAVDLLQALLELQDALADQAPVGLELRLTGTAQADAALLPFEVRPSAHEARRQVPELRQLHLQLALETQRALREDVEDQAVAVEHAAPQAPLEVALLRRGEGRTRDDELRALLAHQLLQLLELAPPDEVTRVRMPARAHDLADDLGSRRRRQLGKFLAFYGVRGPTGCRMNQNGAFAALR